MRATTGSRLIRTIGQVKKIWADFDDAQRRLLEVQLGVPMRRAQPPRIAAGIDELEALYRLEDPRVTDWRSAAAAGGDSRASARTTTTWQLDQR